MDAATAANQEAVEGPGALPEGWCWAPLGQLGTWTGGGTPSKANAAFWANGDIPWVSPKDMKVDVIGDTEDKITAEAVAGSSAKYVPEGSVLMVMRSGILKHSFPVATTDRVVTLNQDLRALTPYGDICPKFVARYLNLAAHRVLNQCSKDGTTVDSIEVSALERLPVPVAPVSEQHRIVARIDALFAEVAEGEAALAEARKGLDIFRRALLKAAVTGELTRDWRAANPATETGHDLIQRMEKAKITKAVARGRGRRNADASQFERGASAKLPKGWAWARVGDLLEFVTSGSRGWKEYYADRGAIFVRAQNINTGVLDLSNVAFVRLPPNAEGLRTRLKADDILVTITGANVTVSARVTQDLPDAYVNQHVALLRPLISLISPWILLWLQAEGAGKSQLVEAAYGAGKPGLNLDNVRDVSIAVPSLEEASEIVRRVSDTLSTSADTLAAIEAEASGGERLRQAILKSAFEGGLAQQDSAEEPASALLARLAVNAPALARRVRNKRARA